MAKKFFFWALHFCLQMGVKVSLSLKRRYVGRGGFLGNPHNFSQGQLMSFFLFTLQWLTFLPKKSLVWLGIARVFCEIKISGKTSGVLWEPEFGAHRRTAGHHFVWILVFHVQPQVKKSTHVEGGHRTKEPERPSRFKNRIPGCVFPMTPPDRMIHNRKGD